VVLATGCFRCLRQVVGNHRLSTL